MVKEIEASWSCSETSGDRLHDVAFYRSLPGLKENIISSSGTGGKGGGPEIDKVILWAGSTVLSSSVFAAAIKAYVALKKRKITLTIGNKKLEYEGSDLEVDQQAIEAMIDKLSDEEGTTAVKMHAEHL